MKSRTLTIALVVLLLAAMVLAMPGESLARSPKSDSEAPMLEWMRLKAYTHEILFWDRGLPHFGACFHGMWGYDPHYTGPGGDGATCDYVCICTWDWWPPGYDECLLTPKSWLGCPYDIDPDRTTASNYNAIV